MIDVNRPKIGVVFLGRKRPGFDLDWGSLIEKRVREWLPKTGFHIFAPAEKAVDDASLRSVVAACEREGVDALALLQTTMGDGRLAPTLAQLWRDAPILWATPENPEGDMISSCSLVGTHCWGSVLRQMDHGFELVYGDPDDPRTRQRFCEAASLVATARRLRSVKIGVVGGHAPGFYAMAPEPFAMHRALGVQLQTYSLVEFSNVVNELPSETVDADVGKVKELGLPHKDTTDADLPMASRLYLAMRSYLDNERLDALTIRCWPEMPNTFGQWPYLGVARLVDEGRAVAMEGDADGALANWMVESLGLGRCYLSDWLEHDRETITLWHVGAAPMSLCRPIGQPGGPRIARHFNVKKPTVVEATLLEDMPVTVFRIWRCDGQYRVTAREGKTLAPRRPLMATNGLAQMNVDPGEWFEEMCHEGMPHHVGVVRGHHAALLKRFARLLRIPFL